MSFLVSLKASKEWQRACDTSGSLPDLDELEQYVVHDIDVERTDVDHAIMLLESPHDLETCRGFPLAGSSGLAVARQLRSVLCVPDEVANCPLGDILRNHRCNDRLRRIGVMNVSQLPMQESPYLCEVRSKFHEPLFTRFSTILINPKAKTRRDYLTARIESLLVECLRTRIKTAPNAFWILCGKVAEAFFCKAKMSLRKEETPCHYRVPHPSYRNLDRDANGDVERLNRKIRNLLSDDDQATRAIQ